MWCRNLKACQLAVREINLEQIVTNENGIGHKNYLQILIIWTRKLSSDESPNDGL